MQWWHGAGLNSAGKAVSHHQVDALAQPVEKAVERTEIITVIAVTHDDVGAACGADARYQRTAVATLRNLHNPGAVRLSDRLGAVSAAVIGHDHLARHAVASEKPAGFGDAAPDRRRFVE